MAPTRVQILGMGPLVPSLKLEDVVREANNVQTSYEFDQGDPIITLGDPDRDGQCYTFDFLANRLKESRQNNHVDILVGVVDSEICEELYSSIDRDRSCIIVSINDIHDILEQSNKSYGDYVLCEVAAQLLAIEYRRKMQITADPEAPEKPWHQETKACLFDWDANRVHTYKKLMFPQLCGACNGLIEQANVPQRVREDCLKLIKAGIRPVRSALEETVRSNLFWTLIGVLLGGLLFSPDSVVPIWLSLLGMTTIILGRFAFAYHNQFTKL